MGAFQFIQDNLRFLAAGMLLMFASSFGQTFFISTFAGEIMARFSLTDGQWGGIYTIGTCASAVAMFWAGALTDRFRVRLLAWVILPGLAVSCFVMAFNPIVPGLILCVFMLRFFGQGMTYQLAAVAMARWFVARRGLALSVSNLGIMIGTAGLPVLCAAMLGWATWQTIWVFAGVLTLLLFPVLLFLLSAERTPQSHAKEAEATGMGNRHWTRVEVIRSPMFWLLIPMLLGPPAWGTSLFFQQVHIAEVKGWPLVSYLSLIPILTVISVVVTLGSGMLIDRYGSGMLLRLYLIPSILGFAMLSQAETLFAAGLAFAVFGISIGLQSTIITAFWAEYFGTRHIGAIKATSASLMVFGSAIGPGITGGFIDLGFPFPQQMLWISGYYIAAMILTWIAINRGEAALAASVEIDVERS